MSRVVRLGLAGLGTVGQGLIQLLAANGAHIERSHGLRFAITRAAVRDPSRRRDVDLAGVQLGTDPLALARADDVDVVVELMGGTDTAGELVRNALAASKPVVTANKALLAEAGEPIFAAAEQQGLPLGFEAAVAGGIPIIKALREGLAGNRVESLAGIINGTSNYILSQMSARGLAFEDALAEAQRLGYAEADPTFDVEGVDAGHKLAILAAIGFSAAIDFSTVSFDGLSRVRAADVALAQELGYRIKPLAIAARRAEGLELRVHPTLIPPEHPLALVDGATNAVRVQSSPVGQTVYVGAGAGAGPTASAVAADLIEIGHWLGHRTPPPPALGCPLAALQRFPSRPADAAVSAWYLRLRVADTPGVLRSITSALAEADISVEAILQKEPRAREDATLAIITSEVAAAGLDQVLQRIRAFDFVRADHSRLRVEHFSD
jgi:homoserine dehydrogenase (EC 1.1.1.3)